MSIDTLLSVPRIHHGVGALSELSNLIDKFGGKPVLVTDPGVTQAGLTDQVVAAAGYELPVFDQVIPEPPVRTYQACVDFLKTHQATVVIGLGGGSSMDVAKLSAVILKGESATVAEALRARDVNHPGLPVIAIPTTAGTGSEVSPAVVYGDPDSGAKVGVRSDWIMPSAALLDPVLTVGLPGWLTASTGMDALTHAIECYTAPMATSISDLFAEEAIALIGEHLPTAYARGADLDAREGMLMGAFAAGVSLANSMVGAVHALAHVMGGLCHVSHGVANAVLLPYVMDYNRVGCRAKYAMVAELLGEPTDGMSLEDASFLGVEAVRQLSISIDIPQRLRDLPQEITENDLERIVKTSLVTQARIYNGNPRTVTEKDLMEIMEAAW